MFSVKEKANYIQLAAVFIPSILSVIFLIIKSWVLLFLCVLSLFAVVGTIPLFKKRESLWMFIAVAFAGFPINLQLACWLVLEEYIGVGFILGNILWGIFLCFVFFSVEEIVFGVVTRLIWRKQYKMKIYQ